MPPKVPKVMSSAESVRLGSAPCASTLSPAHSPISQRMVSPKTTPTAPIAHSGHSARPRRNSETAQPTRIPPVPWAIALS